MELANACAILGIQCFIVQIGLVLRMAGQIKDGENQKRMNQASITENMHRYKTAPVYGSFYSSPFFVRLLPS